MTSEPRPSDHPRPQDAGAPAAGDDLDQAFADVEQEVGHHPTEADQAGVQADADAFAELDEADDVFVIDDEEAAAAAGAESAEAARAAAAKAFASGELSVQDAGSAAAGEEEASSLEDRLFAEPAAAEQGFGAEGAEFSEGAGAGWSGQNLSPQDIGIAAQEGDDRARPGFEEEEEAAWTPPDEDIEIVADENAGEQFGIQPVDESDVSAPASGVWGGGHGTAGGMAGAAQGDEFASAEEGYAEAGVEEDSFDPIYGTDPTAAAQQAAAEEPQEPDYSEYEESYVDQTVETPVVVGAPLAARRRRPLAMVAAAAIVLLGVGAGIAFLRPELLGLPTAPTLVDRALIARPVVEIDVPEPPAPSGGALLATDAPDGNDEPVAQADPPPGNTEPLPTDPAPVAKDPEAGNDEPRPDQPVADPAAPGIDPLLAGDPTAAGEQGELIRVGEDLQVGRAEAMPARPRVHHLAEGIGTGSQAFAQLKNMNFFLGRVKAMDSSFLTLDLTPGEVTIAFDDLNAIVPLASEEYRMMQGSAEGFVRLTNRNKLFGKILNSSLADNVVLEVQQNHVVIPRSSIEEVGQQTRTSVQVLQEEDNDWIKTMLQRQAAQKPSAPGAGPGSTPPPPSGR